MCFFDILLGNGTFLYIALMQKGIKIPKPQKEQFIEFILSSCDIPQGAHFWTYYKD